VIVEEYNTRTPVVNADPVIIKGTTNNAAGGVYEVTAFWGDGSSTSTVIMPDGTWGPIEHVYGPLSFASNPNVVMVAITVPGTENIIVSTKAFSVSVQPPPSIAWLVFVFIGIAVALAIILIFLYRDDRDLRKVVKQLRDKLKVYEPATVGMGNDNSVS
jgi:hypothetical protein